MTIYTKCIMIDKETESGLLIPLCDYLTVIVSQWALSNYSQLCSGIFSPDEEHLLLPGDTR